MGTQVNRSWVAFLAFVSALAAAGEPPGIELLDFMSQWQDEDGVILDPDMFDEQAAEPADPVDGTQDVEP